MIPWCFFCGLDQRFFCSVYLGEMCPGLWFVLGMKYIGEFLNSDFSIWESPIFLEATGILMELFSFFVAQVAFIVCWVLRSQAPRTRDTAPPTGAARDACCGNVRGFVECQILGTPLKSNIATKTGRILKGVTFSKPSAHCMVLAIVALPCTLWRRLLIFQTIILGIQPLVFGDVNLILRGKIQRFVGSVFVHLFLKRNWVGHEHGKWWFYSHVGLYTMEVGLDHDLTYP